MPAAMAVWDVFGTASRTGGYPRYERSLIIGVVELRPPGVTQAYYEYQYRFLDDGSDEDGAEFGKSESLA